MRHRTRDGQARAAVALAGRTLAKVTAVADEISALGGYALAPECDVCYRAQVDQTVAATAAGFGQIDIVVNNAQSTVQRRVQDLTDADVEVNCGETPRSVRMPWPRRPSGACRESRPKSGDGPGSG